MRSLQDTIARLAALKIKNAAAMGGNGTDRLQDLGDFGSNPGDLNARAYVPPGLKPGAPLVVVLHGCTQSAGAYDHGSGWSKLADDQGFALLFPEQKRSNNPNLCFNWFDPKDQARGGGEALSIREMIAAAHRKYGTDPARTFITGLSAGGAMTAVLLAAYPELFAGGAIIAGLPYASATNIPEAFDRMRGAGTPSEADLIARARKASSHKGPWPTLSVWHGSGDQTVSDSNAEAILAQWRGLHGLPAKPSRTETVDGVRRRIWSDGESDLIEHYSIAGMAHGTPLKTANGGYGAAGAFMLEAGISSTERIAQFWKLAGGQGARKTVPKAAPTKAETDRLPAKAEPTIAVRDDSVLEAPVAGPQDKVQKVIEDALRSAGLMR